MPDETIQTHFKTMFPSPAVAEGVVNLLLNPRPAGHSRKSVSPYYKESYARRLKEMIDLNATEQYDIFYSFKDWCADGNKSEKTLYVMVNQSMRYLLDKMDTDKVYAKWYESVQTHRRPHGIVISYIPERSKMRPTLTVPRDLMPAWKVRLEDWIESENTEPFVQDNLALNSEDIKKLKDEFGGIRSIQASITARSVKAIKVR